MSKKKRIANRKCSALLAVGAGAAVCLTGGGVLATNGMVSASNGATSTFGMTTTGVSFSSGFKLFGSKASFSVVATFILSFVGILKATGVGTAKFPVNLTIFATVNPFAAGVAVDAAMSSFVTASAGIMSNTANKYYAISFQDSGTKFGWVHVVQVTNNARLLNIDQWSYNSSGGSIKTLSDSVTTSRLALTDGKEKLHWTNDNEDGVARYEVQSKDASGEWQAADSSVPGSGSYSAKVASGNTCRLIVEMTDGSTKEIDF